MQDRRHLFVQISCRYSYRVIVVQFQEIECHGYFFLGVIWLAPCGEQSGGSLRHDECNRSCCRVIVAWHFRRILSGIIGVEGSGAGTRALSCVSPARYTHQTTAPDRAQSCWSNRRTTFRTDVTSLMRQISFAANWKGQSRNAPAFFCLTPYPGSSTPTLRSSASSYRRPHTAMSSKATPCDSNSVISSSE